MWNVPPTKNSHVRIEEGMDVTLDTSPPPLSSLTVRPMFNVVAHGVLEPPMPCTPSSCPDIQLDAVCLESDAEVVPCPQVAGKLKVSTALRSVRLSAGTIVVEKNGALQLGSRDQPFDGTFELVLNSSLHQFGPSAVSYLDVYGSLQLKSTETGVEDSTVPSWTISISKQSSFVLEEGPSADAIMSGSRLGVVSSKGEEVVVVSSCSKGRVSLTQPLQVKHGAKAIIYNVSRRIRVMGSGNAALRLWNGQPDAGGMVEVKEAAFHQHRRLHFADHASEAVEHHRGASRSQITSSRSAAPRALMQSDPHKNPLQSAVSYKDTNVYKSSLKQPQLAGKVELHGVELSGFGVPSGPRAQAALSMTDYACAVRWPEFRKYISLMNVAMHSLQAGCVDFHGCTGGIEVCCSADRCICAVLRQACMPAAILFQCPCYSLHVLHLMVSAASSACG